MTGFLGWLRGPPPKSAKIQAAERYFESVEVEAMVAMLSSASGGGAIVPSNRQSQQASDHGVPDLVFLRQVCGLPDSVATSALGNNLCAAIRGGQAGSCLAPEDIILAKAKCERMDESSAMDFSFTILDPGGKGAVSKEELQNIIAAAAELCVGSAGATPGTAQPLLVGSCAEAAAAGALTFANSSGRLDRDGHAKWCKAVPALHQVLTSLLAKVGSPKAPASSRGAAAAQGSTTGTTSPAPRPAPMLLPRLVVPPQYRPEGCLMTMQWAWLLSHSLAQDMRQEWRLLFSSDRDGKSFQTLLGRVGEHPNTLLLIKDSAGHVFGGFAPTPWQKNGSFYGDFSTFVFGLEPTALVYHATGINHNFQWCGIGFSQLPNGLGFGGIPGGHFSVFIDATLDHGISRPMATFGNPPLAVAQSFEVAAVECWLVKPPEEDPWNTPAGAPGSVLDRFKETQALMEVAGVQMHSHGLRDPRPEDE